MFPWQDKSGAFAPMKAAVFAALFAPGAWLAYAYYTRELGPRPVTEIIHESGLWTIRLLFLSLAVTPLRAAWRWPNLVTLRRMIGVGALAYAALHLVAYSGDQMFDLAKTASEIVLRTYLTIGAVALVVLIPLGVTSTNGMIRRIGGKRWRRLHQASYAVALLAIVHFFWQSKLDIGEPVVMAGLLLWLLGWRISSGAARGMPLVWMSIAAMICATLTAVGEALYYHLRVGAKLERVLLPNLSLDVGVRSAWIVLAICSAVLAVAAVRNLGNVRRRANADTARAAATQPSR